MYSLDLMISLSALGAFVIFLVLQMIVFRLFHHEAVFKAIVTVFLMTSVIHPAGFLYASPEAGGMAFRLTGCCVSYGIFALMAFVYILCVFGPSETSIRIRIVREIFKGPHGSLSRAELLSRYNSKMLLERRLERLSRSGEIIVQQGKYRLVRKANVFFFIDLVANILLGFVKRK